MTPEQEKIFTAFWDKFRGGVQGYLDKADARAVWEAATQNERGRCAKIANSEKVEDVGPGDEAYNTACEHIEAAILME